MAVAALWNDARDVHDYRDCSGLQYGSGNAAARHLCLALRVPGIPRQKSVDYKDRSFAGPFGQVCDSIGHTLANLRMGRARAECGTDPLHCAETHSKRVHVSHHFVFGLGARKTKLLTRW